MAETKRFALLKAIAASLEDIQKSNGYEHDLDASYYGRDNFGKETAIPFCTTVEIPEQPEVLVERDDVEQQTIPFIVQGFVKNNDSDDAQQDDKPLVAAYELLADMQKAIRPHMVNKFGMGKGNGDYVTAVRAKPGYVALPDEKVYTDYAVIELYVDVIENLTNPYVTP